jgi:hypothetical protein
MVIAPNNEIVLLNVPIEIDMKNQLTFANSNAQFQYFRYIQDQRAYDKVTYVRKDGYVVINDCFDNLIRYNYCIYQNENFSTKWYYAFIIKMEWLSPNSTKVYIKTDVFQTYQFDVNYYASFVEREHINVNEDGIGANLVPENLELGEVIENSSTSIKGLGICYVIAYGRDPSDVGGVTSQYNGCFVNGIASGLWYYIGNMNKVLEMIRTIDNAGYGGDIKAVYSIPTVSILGWDPDYSIDELDDRYQVWGFWVNNQFYSDGREFTLTGIPTTLNGYTPRNQKLRQYPFQYLGFTPTNGTNKIFKYEDFENGIPSFKLVSEINPNPNVYFVPKNFKGVSGVNVSESAVVSGYPSISWKSDYFSNWLAQNSDIVNLNLERDQFNYELGVAKDSANYMGKQIQNAMTLNVGGFAMDSANLLLDTYGNSVNHDYDIKQTMAQVQKTSMLPNTGNVGGSNATLLGYDLYNQDIFTRYSIKRQFAERIDMYFDMYGYQTNKVKLPNITGRPNWNYVKTMGLNVLQKSTSNVPQEDLQEFKAIFNNGVTLWHNPATFLDYSQNNR